MTSHEAQEGFPVHVFHMIVKTIVLDENPPVALRHLSQSECLLAGTDAFDLVTM
jgi:hypothetical protein